MINLDTVSWHPHFVPEVERPKLDRLSTHVVEKVKYQPNSGINLQKISDNQPLPDKNKTMERNLSDKHRSTPLIGKTQ